MSAPAKRSAPEGTPDREGQARAKMQLAGAVPQVLEVDDPVTKVEMSASTIAASRAMLRERIDRGMADVEGRLAQKLEANFRQLKTKINAERAARQVLEEGVRQIGETSANSNPWIKFGGRSGVKDCHRWWFRGGNN